MFTYFSSIILYKEIISNPENNKGLTILVQYEHTIEVMRSNSTNNLPYSSLGNESQIEILA